jgi:predicted TIM-barrel fold metal-dependent hydrolase
VFAAAQLVRDIPNLYACVCGPRAGAVPYLVQTAGARKVLFGSDFGFTDWTILAEFLDNVVEAGLPREVMDHVLYKNAASLLHLTERPLPVLSQTLGKN